MSDITVYGTQNGQQGFFFGNEEQMITFASEANDRFKRNPIIAPAGDYLLDESIQVATTLVSRFNANIECIKTLKAVEDRNYNVTKSEQLKLAGYSGWGAFQSLFNEQDKSTKKRRVKLKAALNDNEYEAAKSSVLSAYYTPYFLTSMLYSIILKNAGFNSTNGANISDPAAGIGGLIAAMPKSMFNNSTLTLVECDTITNRILSQLYPRAKVYSDKYQAIETKSNQSLVIMNPPFNSAKVYDKFDSEIDGLSLHNYFLCKGIKSLRDGGLLLAVVTTSFMDSKRNTARSIISKYADLKGAVRLPMSVFKNHTGANASVDVLLFSRTQNVTVNNWVDAPVMTLQDNTLEHINQYYQSFPDQILGEMQCTGVGQFKSVQCINNANDTDLQALIAAAFNQYFANDIYINEIAAVSPEQLDPVIAPKSSSQIYSQLIVDGYTVTSSNEIALCVTDSDTNITTYEVQQQIANKTAERIRGLVAIKAAMINLLKLETSDITDSKIEAARDNLNKHYDNFVRKLGFINDSANQRAFGSDNYIINLMSLEIDYEKATSRELAKKTNTAFKPSFATKAPIFATRALYPRSLTTYDNPLDALWALWSFKHIIDLGEIAQLCSSNIESVKSALVGKLIFLDPSTNEYVMSHSYLSADVKTKYSLASEAAKTNSDYQVNVDALTAILPVDLNASEIIVNLNSSWILESDIEAFFNELMSCQTTACFVLGSWKVKVENIAYTINHQRFGIPDYPAVKIVERIMLGLDTVVKFTDSDGKRYVLADETVQVESIVTEIKEAFQTWVWNDAERRTRIEQLYNDKLNRTVKPVYDSVNHMTFPDQSASINLRYHQRVAIMRGLEQKSLILDHCTGSGKSFVISALAHEFIRLNLASENGDIIRKVCIIMPNHLITSFATSHSLLYPADTVHAITPDKMSSSKRKMTLSGIKNLSSGIVLIPETNFAMIGIPSFVQEKIINEEIAELEGAISVIDAKQRSFSVRKLETRKLTLQGDLERLTNTPKIDNLDFQDLGFKALLIDEAHSMKNLCYISNTLHNVRGVGNPSGSKRAFDFYCKTRYLRMMNPDAPIIMSTATPIANSILELHTILKYADYDDLKSKGLHHIDSWSSLYTQISADFEVDITGRKFKNVTRLRKFINCPELQAIYGVVAHTVSPAELELYLPKLPSGHSIIPPIAGGRAQPVYSEPSTDQNEYFEELVKRASNFRASPIKNDNALLVLFNARAASLDMRILDNSLPANPNRKTVQCADRIAKSYKKYDSSNSVSLVFCDLSVPKKDRVKNKSEIAQLIELADNGDSVAQNKLNKYTPLEILTATHDTNFSVYDDLKDLLIERGIKPEHVVFAQSYKTPALKEQLYNDMNIGKVRVVVSSTALFGVGVNANQRGAQIHHLDCPLRPDYHTQRNGRFVRQNNRLYEEFVSDFELEIFMYATNRSLDSWSYQLLESKQAFITGFRNGYSEDNSTRVMEINQDDQIGYDEIKAQISGDPMVLEIVQLNKKVEKLRALKQRHLQSQISYQNNNAMHLRNKSKLQGHLLEITGDIADYEESKLPQGAFYATALALGVSNGIDKFSIAGEYLKSQLDYFVINYDHRSTATSDVVMQYCGFNISFSKIDPINRYYTIDIVGKHHYQFKLKPNAVTGIQLINAVKNQLEKLQDTLKYTENQLAHTNTSLDTASEQLGLAFKGETDLLNAKNRLSEIKIQLTATEQPEKNQAA